MRIWKNTNNADASVHCMGNGRLAVYATGPEIVQVFGPPYSSTSFIRLSVAEEGEVEAHSERESGAAIWQHELRRGGARIGRIVDFVDAVLPALVRGIDLKGPLAFDLSVEEGIETLEERDRFASLGARAALLAQSQRGARVFMKYPSPIRFNHQVVISGQASMRRIDGRRWRIECGAGTSRICTTGGASYPECVTAAEAILSLPLETLLARTRSSWAAFSAARRDFATLVPADAPLRDRLLKAIDDVAVLIKAQQGIEGGILAGLSYHWAAFRDQFGAMRCLLALGHLREAKAVLRFIWETFRRRGALHNGHDIGLDGFLHIHENDEVELTGYLLTMALEYEEQSGDTELLREVLPMLEWAFDAELRNLRRHMLPFNGDETYIAGGMLPRAVVNDGSAEATLLFITSGERLLRWLEREGLWSASRMAEARRAVEETRAHYRECFWDGRSILTNNPARMSVDEMPRFRHGVCESGAVLPENRGLRCQDGAIGWVEKNPDGHYLCPACLARGLRFPPGRPIYHLASVSLVPLYLGSDLFSPQEILGAARDIIERYEATGMLTTTPEGTSTVGYDFGLLLTTLSELQHPLAERVYRHMMGVLDSTGAWVEYYRDDKPYGCPCRPYESGINLEAALRFVLPRPRSI